MAVGDGSGAGQEPLSKRVTVARSTERRNGMETTGLSLLSYRVRSDYYGGPRVGMRGMKIRRRAALEGVCAVWEIGGWEESKRSRRRAAAGTSSRRLKRLFGKEERALWRTKPKHGTNTVVAGGGTASQARAGGRLNAILGRGVARCPLATLVLSSVDGASCCRVVGGAPKRRDGGAKGRKRSEGTPISPAAPGGSW